MKHSKPTTKADILNACRSLENQELIEVLEAVRRIKARRVSGALSNQFEPSIPPSRKG